MPPGAKKRKALKKKQQQQQHQPIGTSTNNNNNGDNLHGGNEEHGGSQDDRESDSNLSSPGSQGNEQFGGTQDPSAAALVKDTAKEISEVTQGLGPNSGNGSVVEIGIDEKKTIVENSGNVIAVERGTDDKRFIVEKSPISSYENCTQTAKNAASLDPCLEEITHVVESVSEVVISEKNEHAETSTHSMKSGATKEYPSTGLEKENGKLATRPGSATGTSRKVESESEVPLSSEEKRLLLPGPPAVRTSWLSCCGLFDAMTGSDR
ncbi:unnamed protein product [Eruca vesicaria subsp. sativa]|uniref:Uncharacterized protein n=1 Tax=Eruca vesicaria subsp. sativa TaxID=29727 RepID=A0ABC8KAQ1_ERUVS|nr:unnamed protein product [Eruca vesicaria subsp. sativa]